MMLLGVVLHSAITYGVFNYGDAWSLKDTNSTNAIYDLIVWVIHVFRMPIFFAISGLSTDNSLKALSKYSGEL